MRLNGFRKYHAIILLNGIVLCLFLLNESNISQNDGTSNMMQKDLKQNMTKSDSTSKINNVTWYTSNSTIIVPVQSLIMNLPKKKGLIHSEGLPVGYPCSQHKNDDQNSMDGKRNDKPCDEYSIPFTKDIVPSQCWPREVLLPSFPTSGNKLARQLFALNTGLRYASMYSKEGELLFDYESNNSGNSKLPANKVYADVDDMMCKGNLQLPYHGRVVLVKLHGQYQNLNIIDQADCNFDYVIRLVRNPGDNLLRDICRWRSPRKDQKLFEQLAKRSCKTVISQAKSNWIPFHKSWINASSSFRSKIIHYEDISHPSTAGQAMKDLLSFIHEKQMFDVNYTQAIRVPTYKHGSLFSQYCGLDMARNLHNMTKDISDEIGYMFDYETGVWSVK